MLRSLTVCGMDEIGDLDRTDAMLSVVDPGMEAWIARRLPGLPAKHKVVEVHDVILPEPLTDAERDKISREEGVVLPTVDDAREILTFGRDLMAMGDARVLVHCAAGISRSTASALLLLCQSNGGDVAEAIETLDRIRSNVMPNIYLVQMGDALLDLDDRLTNAVVDYYGTLGDGLVRDALPQSDPSFWQPSETECTLT